jgi:hypothetical protein
MKETFDEIFRRAGKSAKTGFAYKDEPMTSWPSGNHLSELYLTTEKGEPVGAAVSAQEAEEMISSHAKAFFSVSIRNRIGVWYFIWRRAHSGRFEKIGVRRLVADV